MNGLSELFDEAFVLADSLFRLLTLFNSFENVLYCTLCNIIAAASSGARYLERVGGLFNEWIENKLKGDAQYVTPIKRSISGVIEGAIASSLPDRELSELAHSLEERMRFSESGSIVEDALVIAASGNSDMRTLLESINPGTHRFLYIASMLGISVNDICLFDGQNVLNALFSNGLEHRLDVLELKIQVGDGSVANEILKALSHTGLSNQRNLEVRMLMELRSMNHLFRYLSSNSIETLYVMRSSFHAFQGMRADSARKLADYALKIAVQIRPEQVESFSGSLSAIDSAVEAYRIRDLSSGYDQLIPPQLISSLIPVIVSLRVGFLQTARETMMNELDTVNHNARLFLIPKVKEFIDFACLVHLNPGPLSLLQTMIRVFIRVMEAEEVEDHLESHIFNKRIAISTLIDSLYERFSDFAHASGTAYEALVIKTAFTFAQKLKFRLLVEYPELVPDWTPNKSTLVRKIISSFLILDGPFDWESNKVYVALSTATEPQLAEAVSVLSYLHARRNDDSQTSSLDEAPLFTPGLWLKEFLFDPRPTPYASLVHVKIKQPYLERQLVDALFPHFSKTLFEHFDFPLKFGHMANRINAISLIHRANINPRLYNTFLNALQLPREFFRIEMNLGMVHRSWPIVGLLEESILTYFSLIEVFGGAGYSKWSNSFKAVQNCDISFASLKRTLLSGNIALDEHVDVGLLQWIQTFITQMELLTQRFRSRDELDHHSLCLFHYTH